VKYLEIGENASSRLGVSCACPANLLLHVLCIWRKTL
jgi:hypothetical protein